LAGDRRAVENRTGGWLGNATETGRMQKRQDKETDWQFAGQGIYRSRTTE